MSAVLKPQNLLLITAAFSVLAWMSPVATASRGFLERSEISVFGTLLIATWYAVAFLLVGLGVRIGRGLRPLEVLEQVPDRQVLVRLTVLATVGVVFSWYRVLASLDIAAVFESSQANLLAQALPEGAGLQTLRYVSAVSAAVAIHQWMESRRRSTVLLIWNIGLLAGTALLSSRLSIVMCALVVLYLRVARSKRGAMHGWGVALAVMVLFLATTLLNYSRNANFYEARGVTNPLVMNLSEVVAYLGSPTQVAVAMAGSVGTGELSSAWAGRLSSLNLMVPTYVQGGPPDVSGVRYDNLADIATNLTANSVVGDTLYRHGVLGLLIALLVLFVAALALGHLAAYRSLMVVGAACLLYGFAEVWRIWMFNQGILHAIVLAVILSNIPFRAPRR